jgi:hypothetical protein
MSSLRVDGGVDEVWTFTSCDQFPNATSHTWKDIQVWADDTTNTTSFTPNWTNDPDTGETPSCNVPASSTTSRRTRLPIDRGIIK